jgi:hypothetical protein
MSKQEYKVEMRNNQGALLATRYVKSSSPQQAIDSAKRRFSGEWKLARDNKYSAELSRK